MLVPGLPFWNRPLHISFQVDFSAGVVALADHQRGAGVLHVQEAHSLFDRPLFYVFVYNIGKGIKPFAMRSYFKGFFVPVHAVLIISGAFVGAASP